MNWRNRFSIKALGERMILMTYRFPIALTFLAALTLLLSLMVWHESIRNSVYTPTLFYYLYGGILLDICLTLWGEECGNKRRYLILKSAALLVWTVYAVVLIVLKYDWNKASEAFVLGNMAWMTALTLCIPFVSFLREKDDVKAWHFTQALIKSVIISGIVSGFMLCGVLGLLFGTVALFDLPKLNYRVSTTVIIVCLTFVFGVLFLSLIPSGEHKHNTSDEVSKFLRNTVMWLLLPLLGCYMLVLYVYTLKILFTWELPKGLISYLVSAVMCGYLLCYLLLYPQIKSRGSWISKLLTRWLPIAILPLLVLMTVGVARRFSDYGITVQRLYLLTLLLWYYAVCIFILLRKTVRFNWIVLSAAALLVVAAGQPLNYHFICKKILTAQVDKFIIDNSIPTPIDFSELQREASKDEPLSSDSLAEDTYAISSADVEWLFEEITYLRRTFGYESVSQWVDFDTAPTALDRPLSTLVAKTIDYKADTLYCPQGQFSTFRSLEQCYYIHVSSDSVKDGILRICIDDVVLPIDTAAVSRAAAGNLPLYIYVNDGQSVFVAKRLHIYERDDIVIDGFGYYFEK